MTDTPADHIADWHYWNPYRKQMACDLYPNTCPLLNPAIAAVLDDFVTAASVTTDIITTADLAEWTEEVDDNTE